MKHNGYNFTEDDETRRLIPCVQEIRRLVSFHIRISPLAFLCAQGCFLLFPGIDCGQHGEGNHQDERDDDRAHPRHNS